MTSLADSSDVSSFPIPISAFLVAANRSTGTRSTSVELSTRPFRSCVVCSFPIEPPTAASRLSTSARTAPRSRAVIDSSAVRITDWVRTTARSAPGAAFRLVSPSEAGAGAARSALTDPPDPDIASLLLPLPPLHPASAPSASSAPAATSRLTDLFPMTFPVPLLAAGTAARLPL